MDRGRGRSGGRGRRNAENQDRSQNQWFTSGQNRNSRQQQNPGNPTAPRGIMPQYPAAPRGNPWQNPVNPSAPWPNPWQNPVNPAAPRPNQWQNPVNPAAPRPNQRQHPGNPATSGANPWQGPAEGGRGGRGGGGGRGSVTFEYVPRSPVPDPTPSTSSEPPVRELQQLQLSSTMSKAPSEGLGRGPMTRPDDGGKESVRRVELLVNHFKINFKHTFTILHYDIDIKPEKLPKPNAVGKVSKSDALLLRDELFSKDLSTIPLSKTAYDGEKNIFSAVELPTGKFTVTISKGEDMRPRAYVISINLVNKLELRVLDEYLRGRGQFVPRDVLQGMDIVMQENPRRTQLPMGRGFFSRSPDCAYDIGDGIVASMGYQQSLKPTSQGVSLCIDYTVMPFRKAVPVFEFLEEHLKIRFDKRMAPNNNILGRVEKALKGLKVRVTHRNSLQKFIVVGLTRLDANHIRFDHEDPDNNIPKREVSLVEFYFEKYNQDIEYKHFPCLDLSKGQRKNYVPMELCVLIEGQRYPKDDLSRNADKSLREMSLIRPTERKQLICDAVRAQDGPCGGEIARQFGITVSMDMTRVTSRVLSPPTLRLRKTNNESDVLTPQGSCQYNFVKNKVLYGKDVIRWGILDFSQHWTCNFRYTRLEAERFTQALMQRSKQLGIHMENRLFYEISSMDILSKPETLFGLLKHVYHDVAKGNLQILFCPMADTHKGYKTLKRICETEIGIVTQCCLSFLANKCSDQYLANICLKMNAKVGGNNMELYHQLPILGSLGHVMFIGADVNHPTGKDGLSPSITAVVATMNWPAANRYAHRLRAQTHAEKIQHIGEMCSELLEAYARINGVKPESIVFFRDGVSESQFDMVLNEEFAEIRKAIESDGYKPTITLVVAQKRHLTRLFPMNERDGGKSGNVAPGTVVDKTIIHPKEFDFYLNSHYGSLGTSRPTHYHVLWDDHAFSSDQLQRLIYNLCYTFPRCTKPISLVPPVYYADLVAYRGRMYYESLNDLRSPKSAGSTSSSSSSSSTWSISSSPAFDHTKFPLVHRDLENFMICI